jgi:hypothetical protein
MRMPKMLLLLFCCCCPLGTAEECINLKVEPFQPGQRQHKSDPKPEPIR